MTVVPTRAVARKPIVTRFGEAPISGGAARTAISPNPATVCELARIGDRRGDDGRQQGAGKAELQPGSARTAGSRR